MLIEIPAGGRLAPHVMVQKEKKRRKGEGRKGGKGSIGGKSKASVTNSEEQQSEERPKTAPARLLARQVAITTPVRGEAPLITVHSCDDEGENHKDSEFKLDNFVSPAKAFGPRFGNMVNSQHPLPHCVRGIY